MKIIGLAVSTIGLAIILTVGMAANAAAAGGKVKVRVYDSKTKPVDGATVEFYKQQADGTYKLCVCIDPGPAGKCEKAAPDASAKTKKGKAQTKAGGLSPNSKYMAVVKGKCVCEEQACLKDADCEWKADKGGGKSSEPISTDGKGGSAKTTEITLTAE